MYKHIVEISSGSIDAIDKQLLMSLGWTIHINEDKLTLFTTAGRYFNVIDYLYAITSLAVQNYNVTTYSSKVSTI